jgi:hypothetical protein
MRNFLLIGSAFFVIFTVLSVMPFAFAQYAGQGYQSLDEALKIAREKVRITNPNPWTTGNPPPPPQWYQTYWIEEIMGIISGIVVFALLIKSRRITLNKTRPNPET